MTNSEQSGAYAQDALPPRPRPVKMLVQNRSIGSPSTINICLRFPHGAPSMEFLAQRIADLQRKWPYMKYTVIDQRTPTPKMRIRSAPWAADDVLSEEVYTPIEDPDAELNELYDSALRAFQRCNLYNDEPVWGIRVYRSPKPPGREYLCVLVDHVMMDGRGAIRLAKAILAKDVTDLPNEKDDFYAHIPPLAPGRPPLGLMVREIFKAMIIPLLPVWISTWLGYTPTWPGVLQNKCLDSPWRSSILFIDKDTTARFKEIAKAHGIRTLNPALYAAFTAAHWATFQSPLAIKTTTIKDMRGSEDPYCFMGRASVIVTTLPNGPAIDFWELAHVYGKECDDPTHIERGIDLMKMLSLIPDGPLDPTTSPRSQPPEQYPQGDKRAHTKTEAMFLKNTDKLRPPHDSSAIWSNLSYISLPEGADDMVFGVSGNDTGQPINCCLLGHENGVRSQLAYSDGAAMTRQQVGRLQQNFKAVIERVADGKGPWDFRSLSE